MDALVDDVHHFAARWLNEIFPIIRVHVPLLCYRWAPIGRDGAQLNVRREACAHGDALPYSNWRDSLLHDVFLSPSALFRREGNAGANRADLNTDARPRQ
jgi:hypothetical protein